jgi:hypothetical protein
METGAVPPGRDVKCPGCRTVLRVPGSVAGAPTLAPTKSPPARSGATRREDAGGGEVDLRAARRKAFIAVRGGRHHADVFQALRSQGVEERTARTTVMDAVDEATEVREREGRRDLLLGLALFALGLALSLGTWWAASGPQGGVYVVFTGMVVGGLGMAAAGKKKQSHWRAYRDDAHDELAR